MNEEAFRQELIKRFHLHDRNTYSKPVMREGMLFEDYHVKKLKEANGGKWNEKRATERLEEFMKYSEGDFGA